MAVPGARIGQESSAIDKFRHSFVQISSATALELRRVLVGPKKKDMVLPMSLGLYPPPGTCRKSKFSSAEQECPSSGRPVVPSSC
jgi:hypothetical protein